MVSRSTLFMFSFGRASMPRAMLRHTYVTLAMRGKVPLEVVSRLVTHASVQTTSGTYLHASVEDLREALESAGMMQTLGGLL